jgi:dTDP-4-amino-4,6-dideoxygalactose transaminase
MSNSELPVIPVNDLTRYAREITPRLACLSERILTSGYFVLGPAVSEFEEEFARYCGVSHCIGVANGTDALEISLKALGVVPGDNVIVAANAAMYGTSAVLAAGGVPQFADVEERTGLLNVRNVRDALHRCGNAKAVIVTHLYGRLAEMDEIVSACDEVGILVVEDCAQAHGARAPSGKLAGSFGDIATFSFYPTKNLGAIGDGGAIACRDSALAARARQLRQYGWSSKYTNSLPGGRNSRLDELQAAFLLELLPDLDRRNSLRQTIARRYTREIAHPAIVTPPLADGDYVAHLYVVQSSGREALATHLRANGVACDVHYPIPDHRQPILAREFADVVLPATQQWCDRVLTLPCFPEMTEAEVDRVVACCNSWKGDD